MRCIATAAGIMLAGVTMAGAKTIADCAAIDGESARLACYDEVAGRIAPNAPSSATKGTRWNIQTKTSTMTDQQNVFLSVLSEAPAECRSYGTSGTFVPARLVVRCMENTTAVMVTTNCHLADHNGYDVVEYRLDDDSMKATRMRTSTDSTTLGLWSGRRAIPFAKQLFGKDRMQVRFTPFSQSPTTVTFDISGLEQAIKPLRQACGW